MSSKSSEKRVLKLGEHEQKLKDINDERKVDGLDEDTLFPEKKVFATICRKMMTLQKDGMTNENDRAIIIRHEEGVKENDNSLLFKLILQKEAEISEQIAALEIVRRSLRELEVIFDKRPDKQTAKRKRDDSTTSTVLSIEVQATVFEYLMGFTPFA